MKIHNRQTVDSFFESIRPWQDGYTHISFSYFAVLKNDIYHLLQGVLLLNNRPVRDTDDHFECQAVRAGVFDLTRHGITKEIFIDQIINGEISTPVGKMFLPRQEDQGVSAYFEPISRGGIDTRSRWALLSLTGSQSPSYFNQTELDWMLKSASTPFDSINEIFNEYHLGNYRPDRSSVDVVAFNVAEIDFSSNVEGVNAKPGIFLAENLDASKAAIGYKVVKGGKVSRRGLIKSESLRWVLERPYWRRGEGDLTIEPGAVLQLFANYDGFVHHDGWVGDSKSFQNARRVILDTFDAGLEVLNDYLFEKNKERKFSRDFEVGVAFLADMLGFSVSHIGGSKRLEDAIDIIATTPRNNIALIECTTGLLNNDNKLSKLIDRSALLRRNLAMSGNDHLRVLPVIVTSKTREDVRADLENAKRLKILVITREDLLAAIGRTVAWQDADQQFEEWERSLSESPVLN